MMMKLIRKIRWAFAKNKLEQSLIKYCATEYRPSDRAWALCHAMSENKAKFLGEQ